MSRPLRLLLIEDSPDDAALILRELERGGLAVEHQRVDTEDALRAQLRQPWDLIISDYSMPAFDGLRAFGLVQAERVDAPFIFVSGYLGEERAVEAMRAGARDYLVKGRLQRLVEVVRREVDQTGHARQQRALEAALQVEEQRARSVFDSATAALLEVDLSGVFPLLVAGAAPDEALLRHAARVTWVAGANRAAAGLLGVATAESLVGPMEKLLRPGSMAAWRALVESLLHRGADTVHQEFTLEGLDGRVVEILLSYVVPRTAADARHVVLSVVDLTDRKELERQLHAAQRMEAVGRLASGVAHDFNNILTIIETYSWFVRDAVGETHAAVQDITAIQDAVRRACGLTRQLLAFGARQPTSRRVLSINLLLQDMERMLHRVLGEDVQLVTSLAEDLGNVELDPTHVEQVILNLVINARDALPRGGTIHVVTANVDASQAPGAPVGTGPVAPGAYVSLQVRDNGVGMNAETQARIFEPFFTTKGPGQGTGLGLSTVYGIIRQAHGQMWVDSAPGAGATFTLWFPRTAQPAPAERPGAPWPTTAAERHTVLLVEDDAALRTATRRVLERAGMEVVEAANANMALHTVTQDVQRPVDLLLTDVVLPGMSGPELAARLLALQPHLRVLFMTGNILQLEAHGLREGGDAHIMAKPFTPAELLSHVARALAPAAEPDARH